MGIFDWLITKNKLIKALEESQNGFVGISACGLGYIDYK
jgi:hypothetical protein